MGFFDSSSTNEQLTLLDPAQQALLGQLGSRFGNIAGRDPFSLEGAQDLFQQNFLQPALYGATRQGGTIDQFNAGVGGVSGSLSSRASLGRANIFGQAQQQAQQEFGRFLPQMIGQQLQGQRNINDFLGIRTFENIVTPQSSMFSNVLGAVGGIASIAAI